MEVLLHKVCGRPASRTMTLRAAGPEDAAAFYALQNEVRAAMPHPEQFVPDTLENIARYLKEDLCIGGWDGGRLGAYFILRYCGQDAHNYAVFMGIPRDHAVPRRNCRCGFLVVAVRLRRFRYIDRLRNISPAFRPTRRSRPLFRPVELCSVHRTNRRAIQISKTGLYLSFS